MAHVAVSEMVEAQVRDVSDVIFRLESPLTTLDGVSFVDILLDLVAVCEQLEVGGWVLVAHHELVVPNGVVCH